jgi:hypothetical protein
MPVIFITGTPSECKPCNPPGVILGKPVSRDALRTAYHQMV